MKKLTTFEDIFNRLIEEYKGKTVQISTGQDGINIASFLTRINDISIKPLNKKQSKKWTDKNKKVGLIIIKEHNSTTKIPFLLGFDTMKAVFLKNGVTINSMNMEFTIRKDISTRKRLA